MSEKKHIVRLTDSERKVCADVIAKLKGTGQKVRRAQMLLKADADGFIEQLGRRWPLAYAIEHQQSEVARCLLDPAAIRSPS